MEEWAGFAEGCEVSSLGNVVHVYAGKRHLIKPFNDSDGYAHVQISINGRRITFSVHRLVANAFVPNPFGKPEVNHWNGIKTDNRAENLLWATRSENEKHAYDIGLAATGEARYNAKLTNAQVKWIRAVYKPHDKEFGQRALAKMFGVDKSTIRHVVIGETYSRVK